MSLAKYASTVEQTLANKIISDALAAGYAISVIDGEEVTVKQSSDADTIRNAMATTEFDTLLFYRDGKSVGLVILIWGNGRDLISDYSDNAEVEVILSGAMDLSDTL